MFGGRLADSVLDHIFPSRMFSLQYKAKENKTKQPNTLSNKKKLVKHQNISAICLQKNIKSKPSLADFQVFSTQNVSSFTNFLQFP